MKINIHQLIVGTSYLCLLRTSLATLPASNCPRTVNMSTESCKTYSYEPSSSSIAYVTTPDETSAKKLAFTLVEKKLAACVNIIPKITSIYVWEGKVNEESEYLMMVKTRTSRLDDLIKHVRDNHPYSVAEVITTPIAKGNPQYMEWIEQSVSDACVQEKE